MKSFSNETITALQQEEACIFTFITIEFPNGIKRYSDADIVLYYDGNRYAPHPIDINLPSFSVGMESDTVGITISDIALDFSYEAQSSDILRSPMEILIATMGNDYQISSVDNLAVGYLDSWRREEHSAEITMCNIFRSWHKKTLRKTRSACQWYWKSAECGYNGTSTVCCNQTYSQCVQYGNQLNYGGFRFVDLLKDVAIYWGRNPDRA